MTRILSAILLFITASAAQAQDIPSVFANYAAYEAYVEETGKTRQFGDMLVRLGGGDEYESEEIARIQAQVMGIFPQDFDGAELAQRIELENGFAEEVRVFYRERTTAYIFVYTLIHERDDALIVLNFSFNTRAEPIFDKL